MTLSLLSKSADEAARLDTKGGPFHFVLRWHEPTWLTRPLGGHGHWEVEDSLHFVNEMPGDKGHSPSEADMVKMLIAHYGPGSSVGKALTQKRYEFWGTAAQVT